MNRQTYIVAFDGPSILAAAGSPIPRAQSRHAVSRHRCEMDRQTDEVACDGLAPLAGCPIPRAQSRDAVSSHRCQVDTQTDAACDALPPLAAPLHNQAYPWAAPCDTWLLTKFKPRGVVFSFLF